MCLWFRTDDDRSAYFRRSPAGGDIQNFVTGYLADSATLLPLFLGEKDEGFVGYHVGPLCVVNRLGNVGICDLLSRARIAHKARTCPQCRPPHSFLLWPGRCIDPAL